MKKLDTKFINKFFNKLSQYSNTIPADGPYRPSDRELFASRFGKRLGNRAFKVRFTENFGPYDEREPKSYIDYCLFLHQNTTVDGKFHNSHCGFRQINSWSGDQIRLDYVNYRGEWIEKDLTRSDFYDIEIEEITMKEFTNILNLFN